MYKYRVNPLPATVSTIILMFIHRANILAHRATRNLRVRHYIGASRAKCYEDVDVESRMNQKESLQTFHRKHDASSDFEHYTPEQKARLKKSLLKVVKEAEACNKSSTLKLDEYLNFFQ